MLRPGSMQQGFLPTDGKFIAFDAVDPSRPHFGVCFLPKLDSFGGRRSVQPQPKGASAVSGHNAVAAKLQDTIQFASRGLPAMRSVDHPPSSLQLFKITLVGAPILSLWEWG